MKTIMVQMADKQWTMEAMHLASAVARNTDARIVLLRLALANNPGLLGWGMMAPTAEERRQMEEYASIAEDYGVEFDVQPMQFVTLVDALAQAARQRQAAALFAHIPHSSIPYWRRFRLWSLKRQLGDCRLYTLEEPQPIRFEEPALAETDRLKSPLS